MLIRRLQDVDGTLYLAQEDVFCFLHQWAERVKAGEDDLGAELIEKSVEKISDVAATVRTLGA